MALQVTNTYGKIETIDNPYINSLSDPKKIYKNQLQLQTANLQLILGTMGLKQELKYRIKAVYLWLIVFLYSFNILQKIFYKQQVENISRF